jgi:glyoxylase-like metal-dependent hydrolase (beta-lactamase superfamily II)
MLVRQLFNHANFSYTYLLADPLSEEAVLIDPIKEKLRDYVQLFNELGYILTAAIDTHTHDDSTSGLWALRDLWGCDTIAGTPSQTPGLTHVVEDGDVIVVGALQIDVIHTPGHTDDSYCFFVEEPGKSALFTGDTLLVRTVGLSDQPTSNKRMHYDSLINVLAVLPERTLIYPGKDFKGWPLSTIGEEKQFNPYLNAGSVEQFLALKEVQKRADIKPTEVYDEDEAAAATGSSTTTADKASAIVKAAAQAAARRELDTDPQAETRASPFELDEPEPERETYALVNPETGKIAAAETPEPEVPEMVIEQTIMDSEYAMPNDPFSGRDSAREKREEKPEEKPEDPVPDDPVEGCTVPSWR